MILIYHFYTFKMSIKQLIINFRYLIMYYTPYSTVTN